MFYHLMALQCDLSSEDAGVFLCLLGEFWMAWAANSRTTLALNLNKAPKTSLCWLQIICPRILQAEHIFLQIYAIKISLIFVVSFQQGNSRRMKI